MPTICLDCRYIRPRPSGIGAVVRALVDHLPGLAPDWHFKLLRHPDWPGTLSGAANVSEVVVRAQVNGPAGMWLLPRLVELSDVDLFHAPSNILPHGLTMPAVTTIHDLMWLDSPQLCNPRLWGRVERLFYRHGITRALNQSAAIMTVSEATRSAILRRRPDLSGRVHAALPGVPDGFTTGDGPGRAPYILTIGQHAPYKNHEGAIRAFAAAFAERPAMELLMVQRQGPGRARLQHLAQQLNIGEKVRFLPPQGQAELATLYRGAIALLHPSLCEGFGLPLAEAMASGCPVITSNLSAMPEVTGGAALLVDPHDTAALANALVRVAEEPELAATLRRKGLARAAELSQQAFARANLEVYRKVLSGL